MRTGLITLWGLAFLAGSAQAAQGPNLEDLAQRLLRQTDNLAQRSYDSFTNLRNPSRSDLEALYQARSLSASAELFHRLVRAGRSNSELREAFSVLQGYMQTSGNLPFDRGYWSDVQRASDDLARELNLGSGRGRQYERVTRNDRDVASSGRLNWRGTVDGESQLVVRRSNVDTRTISGRPTSGITFAFTSPLPRRATTVRLEKKEGRGVVEIVQQPSESNDFTAVVRIRDEKGGTDEYEFELIW
jgi:hypothetical protein